jgi:hypothetical protein
MDENRISGEALEITAARCKRVYRGCQNSSRRDCQSGYRNGPGLYGQPRDTASDLARDMRPVARESGSNFEFTLRNAIETQPVTSILIAF